MANIVIQTTDEEQQKIIDVLKQIVPMRAISVAKIAKEAHLNSTRARYAIMDLEEQGRLKRIPLKAFNKNYIRYGYKVL